VQRPSEWADICVLGLMYSASSSGPQQLSEAQCRGIVPLLDLVQCRVTRQRGIGHHQTRERSSASTATKMAPMTKSVPTKSPKLIAILVATKSASRRS